MLCIRCVIGCGDENQDNGGKEEEGVEEEEEKEEDEEGTTNYDCYSSKVLLTLVISHPMHFWDNQ